MLSPPQAPEEGVKSIVSVSLEKVQHDHIQREQQRQPRILAKSSLNEEERIKKRAKSALNGERKKPISHPFKGVVEVVFLYFFKLPFFPFSSNW